MPSYTGLEITETQVSFINQDGVLRVFLYNDIPQNVINQGAAAVEAFMVDILDKPVNDFAVSPEGVRRFFSAAHVLSLSPVSATFRFANAPITGTWWLPRP